MELACAVRVFGMAERLAESLEKISRAGYRAVELDWETICRQLSTESRRVEMIKTMVSEHNLEIAGVYLGSLTAEREDQLQLQTRDLSKHFEAIKKMGSGLAILSGGVRTLENYNCLRDGLLGNLAKEAERVDLDLAVVNQHDTRVENQQDFLALFSGKTPERIGVCVDFFHCHLSAVNPGDVIREMGYRLKLVRVSDMMGTMPVQMGQGQVEIKGLVRTLRKVGYDGRLVIDHLPMRQEKIEREIEQTYGYLQGIVS